MDRRLFLQKVAMLAAAYGLPGVAIATEQLTPPIKTMENSPNSGFFITDEEPYTFVYKVVGIGGAGCNAVEQMIRESEGWFDMHHDEFIRFVCVDTDAQALDSSTADTKLLLGTGLGAGAEPFGAHAISSSERDGIVDVLRGADHVFIVAGMGGSTGTAVSSVVAEAAHQLGIYCAAVVTQPFESESNRRRIAREGIAELAQHIDSPIVLSFEHIKKELGEHVSRQEAYRHADKLMKVAVSSIPFYLSQEIGCGDISDIRCALGEKGRGAIGIATAEGPGRARKAAEQAINSPLLGRSDLSRANGVLVNITAGRPLRMQELHEIISTVNEVVSSEDVIASYGAKFDEGMEDKLRVTVIATGIGSTGNRLVQS